MRKNAEKKIVKKAGRVRKVDMYLNLKEYRVTEAMIEGAKAMAMWYGAEGNKKMDTEIAMLMLRVNNNVAIGEVSGRLQAYTDRFTKLVQACEVLEEEVA